MKTIKVSIWYNIHPVIQPDGTHIYEQEYTATNDHCPRCHKQLWSAADEGDYYKGPKFYCPHCFWTGYVISCHTADPTGYNADDQTIRAIRNEIFKKS